MSTILDILGTTVKFCLCPNYIALIWTCFREQELSNLLQRKQFTKAIGLALTLEQPLRTLNVIKGEVLSIR